MEQPTYLRPSDLDGALEALRAGSVTVAAGCTDLFPTTERKALPGAILDISGIPALRAISRSADGVRLGATATWTDILRADLPAALDGLKLAAREVGARQIQNRGTIGGNLCNASPAADGVPPLLTLDAAVELASVRGVRIVPVAEFLTGPRQTALRSDEMVSAVHIPDRALQGQGAFLKLGARAYLVISIAMSAARVVVEDGKIVQAALAIGACGPVAQRLPDLEAAMLGQPAHPDVITPALVARYVAPIDDIRADAAYRKAAAVELLRRVLIDATTRRREAA